MSEGVSSCYGDRSAPVPEISCLVVGGIIAIAGAIFTLAAFQVYPFGFPNMISNLGQLGQYIGYGITGGGLVIFTAGVISGMVKHYLESSEEDFSDSHGNVYVIPKSSLLPLIVTDKVTLDEGFSRTHENVNPIPKSSFLPPIIKDTVTLDAIYGELIKNRTTFSKLSFTEQRALAIKQVNALPLETCVQHLETIEKFCLERLENTSKMIENFLENSSNYKLANYKWELDPWQEVLLTAFLSQPQLKTQSIKNIYDGLKNQPKGAAYFKKLCNQMLRSMPLEVYEQFVGCFIGDLDPNRPNWMLESICQDSKFCESRIAIQFVSKTVFNKETKDPSTFILYLLQQIREGKLKDHDCSKTLGEALVGPILLGSSSHENEEWFQGCLKESYVLFEKLDTNSEESKFINTENREAFLDRLKGKFFAVFAEFIVKKYCEGKGNPWDVDAGSYSIFAKIINHPDFSLETFDHLLIIETKSMRALLTTTSMKGERLKGIVDHILKKYNETHQLNEKSLWIENLNLVAELYMNRQIIVDSTSERLERFKLFAYCISYSYTHSAKSPWQPSEQEGYVLEFIFMNSNFIANDDHLIQTLIDRLLVLDPKVMTTLLTLMAKDKVALEVAVDHILEKYNQTHKLNDKSPWINMLNIVSTLFLNETIATGTDSKTQSRYEFFIYCVSYLYTYSAKRPWTPNEVQGEVLAFIFRDSESIANQSHLIQTLLDRLLILDSKVMTALLTSMAKSKVAIAVAVDYILKKYDEDKLNVNSPWIAMLHVISTLFLKKRITIDTNIKAWERYKLFIYCMSYLFKQSSKQPWTPNKEQTEVLTFIFENSGPFDDDSVLIATLLIATLMDRLLILDPKVMITLLSSMNDVARVVAVDYILEQYKSFTEKKSLEVLRPWAELVKVVFNLIVSKKITLEQGDARFYLLARCMAYGYKEYQLFKAELEAFHEILKSNNLLSEVNDSVKEAFTNLNLG